MVFGTRFVEYHITTKLAVIKDYETAFDAVTLIQMAPRCLTFNLCLLLKSKTFHQQPGFYRTYSVTKFMPF